MFDTGELQTMSDEGLIDALRRAHGAAAFAQAAEVSTVRELYRRHPKGESAPEGVSGGECAGTEAAVAVQISERVAAALIDVGLALDRLPHTRAAFADGRIDLARTQVIVETTRRVSTETVTELEKTLIEAAERSTPGRLWQTARRWVAKADPDGEARRRERREQDRDVRTTAAQDGMAVVDALLPAAGAQTLLARVREMERQVCQEDPRSVPQRRADSLVALADGSGRLRCRCERGADCPAQRALGPTPRPPLIQIGVPIGTLLGESDHPAFLAGYGPLDADLTRVLAEHAQFQVIPERTDEGGTDDKAPPPGTSSQIEREVRAVDGECRFPGCTMPAAECLLEPVERVGVAAPDRDGRTAMARAVALCPHHHRLTSRTDRGTPPWRRHCLDTDRLQWVGPSGLVHTTVREGARYLFPHTDVEAPDIEKISPTAAPARSWSIVLDLCYPFDHAGEQLPPSSVPIEDRP